MKIRELLAQATGFDWDADNLDKNLIKHGVDFWEAEEVFFNLPLVVRPDPGHSHSEVRFYALGRTDSGRFLFVAFTLRDKRIRVISTRDMNRHELAAYKHHEKKADS